MKSKQDIVLRGQLKLLAMLDNSWEEVNMIPLSDTIRKIAFRFKPKEIPKRNFSEALSKLNRFFKDPENIQKSINFILKSKRDKERKILDIENYLTENIKDKKGLKAWLPAGSTLKDFSNWIVENESDK